MTHLSHAEKLEYTDLFLRVNEQFGKGDGALTIQEFEKFLIISGIRLPREVVAAQFALNDTDGNWKITLDEFLAKMPNIVPAGSALSFAAKIRRKYNEFDITNDGYISYEELKAVLTRQGAVTEEWLKSYMKEWDKDGDGRINFEEFLIMYIKTVLLDREGEQFKQEDEELVVRMTELILSSDKLRRLCYSKNLIKAGVVAAGDMKSLMSEVTVRLSDDQFNECIKQLCGREDGEVNLEEFISQYETIVVGAYDKMDAERAEKEREGKRETGEEKASVTKEGDASATEEGDAERKSEKVLEKKKDPGQEDRENSGGCFDEDKPKPGSNVKEMVQNLEKITL